MEKNQEQLEAFVKMWRKLLIDLGTNESQVAKLIGTSQANLNRKIITGSIKHMELISILDQLDYTIEFVKKS